MIFIIDNGTRKHRVEGISRCDALARHFCVHEDEITFIEDGYHAEAEDLYAAIYEVHGRRFTVMEAKRPTALDVGWSNAGYCHMVNLGEDWQNVKMGDEVKVVDRDDNIVGFATVINKPLTNIVAVSYFISGQKLHRRVLA